MSRVAILTLAAAVAVALPGGAQQAPVFRSTSDVVPLFVTVTDKSGRLATDLTRDDFQVFDNGKPQPLTLFDNSPQPIRLIALMDISGSVAHSAPVLARAVSELLANLGPGDLARIGTFGQAIAISPVFTRNIADLAAWLSPVVLPNQPTPLWRAVDQAMTLFADASAGRRVVLIFSDGKDGGYQLGTKFLLPANISDRAEREDVMIYGVGIRSTFQPGGGGGGISDLGDRMAATLPDPSLGGVALDTGGGYFELRGRDDLAATFGRVADELHRQYLLGFAPPTKDGKVHKIEVRLKRDGLKARVRKTYVAPK